LKNQGVFLSGMVEDMIGIKIKLQKSVSQCQPVPRHREIKESLAKHILKKLA